MTERILNDFIEDSNFNLTKDFIQKANNFIATYKNKNVCLTNILNYIVEKDKSYSFKKDERIVEIYNTKFYFSDYEQRKGVMIKIKTDKGSDVGKYFSNQLFTYEEYIQFENKYVYVLQTLYKLSPDNYFIIKNRIIFVEKNVVLVFSHDFDFSYHCFKFY